MSNSVTLDTPRKKQKSLITKIFSQLTIQSEDIGASIEYKQRLVESYDAYPDILETYVGNYILTERQRIVDAAEAKLRPYLKPVEKRQRQITSTQHQRDLELKEAQKRKQIEMELCRKADEKNQKAITQLQSIINALENRLELMGKDC